MTQVRHHPVAACRWWPWYGRHPSENAWPSWLGWLIDWVADSSGTDDDGVRLHWQLQLCDWQVDLHARKTLELRLATEHQDELPCQVGMLCAAYWQRW